MQADQYAVIGHPISHSKSPTIHTLFAEQTGQTMEYTAIDAEPGDFRAAVERFRAAGGRGLNVTVPFKQEAWVYADQLGPYAERAEAVNTLVFQGNGTVAGDNTDGLGLVRDLTVNQGFDLTGKRLLILGAGGAVRGVLQPLLAEEPESLVIANRSRDKAANLGLLFGDMGQISGCGYDGIEQRRFDLIINATSLGLDDRMPTLPDGLLADGGWCYDLYYSDQPTAFMRWGEQQGAGRCLDGLGMLVEQAAESFQRWRGVRPETGPVMMTLRPKD